MASRAAGLASNVATLTVASISSRGPPVITIQPSGVATPAGVAATFVVTATGATPLSYQWLKNNATLAGATGSLLAIPNPQSADAGSYAVVVSNDLGSVTSSVVTLSILAGTSITGQPTPPAISTQPASVTVAVGGTATFSVAATGTAPLSYSWLKDGLPVPGATGPVLTLPNVPPSPPVAYRVVVSNATGSVSSETAMLTIPVPAPPEITLQPRTQSVVAGANVSFAVGASGDGLLYQWTKNGVPISGATAATYLLAGATVPDAGNYAVIVSNRISAVTSVSAALVVNPAATAPVITLNPSSAAAVAGANISFFVTAMGTPPLAYQWNRNGVAVSGATAATLTVNNIQATDAASYTVVVSNNAGSVTSSAAVLSLAPAARIPTISSQPLSQSAAVGSAAVFNVAVDGTAPFVYQWFKNGSTITGATSASLAFNPAMPSDAGSYSVSVSNSAGRVTSGAATLTINSSAGIPTIITNPADVTAHLGAQASFAVTASGSAPLSYEWRKNGFVISGATGPTLTLANVQPSDAVLYSVAVSNGFGTAISRAATLTVRGRSYAGRYFGTFSDGGSFAFNVRDDNTGDFLGYATGAQVAFVNRRINVDDAGHFQCSTEPSVVKASELGRAVAAASVTLSATIASDGSLAGSVSGLGTTLAATRAPDTGATQTVAGFYQAGTNNSSATAYSIVGATGEVFLLTVSPTAADAGRGSVDASGKLSVTTAANATVTGTLASATLTASVLTASGVKVDYVGGSDARSPIERLLNISTRGVVGGGAAGAMIAGFVIKSDAPKRVMIRGIGPALAGFGVSNALPTVRLELFNSANVSIAVNSAWGLASNASDIASAAASVGAFALEPDSRDTVLLLTLDAGAYTAVISSDSNSPGVALIEVYDLTQIAAGAQKVINISSRTSAGGGVNTLIAGFYIGGILPKRVLIRGIGPMLTTFGVPDVLADPLLTLYNSSGATVATNDNWSTPVTINNADITSLAAAASAVGAFALAPGSKDAALLLNLAPGGYTIQVSGSAPTPGNALVEVYEVP